MAVLLPQTLILRPMNKLFLWLVGLFNPVWTALGADPKAVYLILKAKLLMDDRGGLVMGQRQKKKKGMEYLVYVFVGLFGIFLVMLFKFCADPATAIGLGFCMWICYIGLLLITEMSENLFDQRDLYVLLSRPINDLTLSISRILHIAVFSSKFALCLGTPSFIYLLFVEGPWAGFVYFLLGIIAVVLTMTLTLVSYLVLLRRVAPERLKKIVGYFQILATLVFFLAYQLPSLMEDMSMMKDIRLVDEPSGFAFPGLWLGGLYKALTTTDTGYLAYAQGGLALVAAGFGLWFYIRQSVGYADRLLSLRHAGATAATATSKTAQPTSDKSPVRDWLAGLLTRPNQERVSFKFHWNVMVRDMTFKQRTYPTLVYVPVILAITVFRDFFKEDEPFSLGPGMILMMMYFLMWVVVIPLGQTKVSENYRASWIFDATANPYPGRIQLGQVFAVLGMFFLPMAVLVYGAVLAFWGLTYAPDVLLACGNTLLFSLCYNQMDKAHPFSRAKDDSKFQNFGPFLMVGLLGAIFGFGHYGLRYLPFAVPAATLVVWAILIAGFFWWRRKGG